MTTTTMKLKKWLRAHALRICWQASRAVYLWAEGKRPAGGFFQHSTKPVNGRKK